MKRTIMLTLGASGIAVFCVAGYLAWTYMPSVRSLFTATKTNVPEASPSPSPIVPNTNPFNVKTNPFKDANTNPFKDAYKNPFQ